MVDNLSDFGALHGGAPTPASKYPIAPTAPTRTPSPNNLMSDAEFLGYGARAAQPAQQTMSDADFRGISAPSKPPMTSSPALGAVANMGDEGWWSGAAKGTATATIKGLSNSLGTVGNLGNFADYLVARGESAITGRPYEEVAQRHQARRAQMESESPVLKYTNPSNLFPSGEQVAAPILRQTGEYVPESMPGRLGMAGIEAATGMVGPGGGTVAEGAKLGQALIRTPAAMAPANIVAGGVGQGVTDVTGDPLLGMGAGLGATALSGVAGKGINLATKPFREDIPLAGKIPFVGKAFTGQREAMVGEQLRNAATSPDVVDRALNPGPLQPGTEPNLQILPGSKPTLGQLSGDQGILQAERQARTLDNSGFNLREGEQNQARLEALRGTVPSGADTMKPSEAFQSHLANLDQATEAAVSHLQSRARDFAAQLGPGMTPEAAGTAIRSGIEAMRGESKAARRALYDAADPDHSLNLVASPVRDAGNNIQGKIGPYAEQPSGKEASILSDAAKLPDVMKFRDLMDFDQRISAAMSEERARPGGGETPAWGRMVQLKSAIQETINNALENQVAFDRQAVAKGDLAPDQTTEARLQGYWGVGNAGRATTNRTVTRAGENAGDISGGSPPSDIGPIGAGNEAAGRLGAPPGDQGIPTALQPNFDEAAAARLAAAKAGHVEYARTYRQGPVAPILKGPFQGNYTLPASAVPSRAFVKGDRGYQMVKSFLAAAKNNPDVLPALQDHALNPLRDSLNPDGTVNPKKFASWRGDYADSLRAIDEASPGFSDRFSSAAKATEEMMKVGLERKNALDAFQKTAAAKFVGKTSPIEVENQLGLMLRSKANGPTKMRELVSQTKKSPQALNGLRKAGVDWMVREFSNAAEAPGTGEKTISSAKFRKFVNDNRATLVQLYSEAQANMFRAIADDLQRSDRSVTATAVKGSPGSAKDILPFLKQGLKKAEQHGASNLLGLGAILEMTHGEITLPMLAYGATALAVKHYISGLRDAGITKTQDMFRDALLNPDRARYYLSKSPSLSETGPLYALSRSVRRALITQPVLGNRLEEQRAIGGRVTVDRNTKRSVVATK